MAASKTAVDMAAAMVQSPVALSDWLLVAPTLLTMLGGSIALMLRSKTRLQPVIGITTILLVVVSNMALLDHVLRGGPIAMVMGSWLPPFGIAFTADAMGVVFALAASIVALCVAIYATSSVAEQERRYGFYPFLIMLLCGVSGSFLTGDIFNLYVWFEVMLISSFGMIVLGNEKPQLDGAVKYTLLNLVATTLFLLTTGLLYGLVGTLNMADIAQKVKELPSVTPILVLSGMYFFAFAMKAAAFPVNFWLPASYHTPRIVVAAVFAGLLTKVGVYALLRVMLLILPEGREWLTPLITVIAIVTMLSGAFGALAQTDVRRIFAYMVIAGVGSMLAGLAVGSQVAVAGSIFYAVHSIFAMTSLFLLVGYMKVLGGSYSLRELGGLYSKSPLLAAIALVLLLAGAGLPPFSGFWPKVLLVEGSLENGQGWLAATILVTSVLQAITVGRVWIFCFWRGGPEGTPDGTLVLNKDGSAVLASAMPLSVLVSLLALTSLVVLIGLQPEFLMDAAHKGAMSLMNPSSYIGAVFGGGS
ncbi:Na+/H+ antiporter subunit D [Flexibacterium corallicola]|uniref:Na+/H+ antiporter subunit D n=1 Tax=Flexibacterium corallicola TaxID=3037259 RepID=UPI00286F39EA|nr:Na+/H+ antiporter subunit D [Pseudovibrio sp. M1P-2-3]